MHLGLQLLGSLVDSQRGSQDYIRLTIDNELFHGPVEEQYFQFVSNHIQKYGVLPTRETLLSVGLSPLPETTEPAEYYFDQCRQRRMHYIFREAAIEGQEFLNNHEPEQVLNIFQKACFEATKVKYKNNMINFQADGAKSVVQEMHYKKQNPHDTGLSTGWETLDKMSGGILPGDVISIVGRPGMGKTFMLLFIALNMWRAHGITPTVFSMEMQIPLIMQRISAMFTRKSLTAIKKAYLTTAAFEEFMLQLEQLKQMAEFWIIDGTMLDSFDRVLTITNQIKPGAVFIDGAYLLKHPDKRLDMYRSVAENARAIKLQLAEGIGVPVVATWQFARKMESKKKNPKEIGLEDIAHSDEIGQLSSVVLALLEDESVETMMQRLVSILKGRSGEKGEFSINWRFNSPPYMDFTEAPRQVGELNFL